VTTRIRFRPAAVDPRPGCPPGRGGPPGYHVAVGVIGQGGDGPGREPARMRARRASSFGAQAAAYAQHRPDYAQAAVEWALDPVRDRDTVRVVDVGAGTGKLTGSIERLAASPRWAGRLSVVAVEPDPAMLAELRRVMPQTTAMAGSAERIPLPDASVDAVVCGQAAHWFDMDLAVPEIARVLTGGGVFAGLWNMDDDREPWVAGLAGVYVPSNTRSSWLANRHDWPAEDAAGRRPFGPAARAEFAHGQRHTADSLVALVATHSRMLVMDPAERAEQLDRVRGYLASRPETASGEFRVPMLTGVLRSVKS
jgi:SAM-dependent methyltransferase